MKLVDRETAEEIIPGRALHIASGPAMGQMWRYEHITPHHTEGHHLVCSRRVPRMGRVVRTFHPSVFGLEIVIDVKIYADRQKVMHAFAWMGTQLFLLIIGGFIAWAIAEYMQAGVK